MENLSIKGIIIAEIFDEQNKLIRKVKIENLITNNGMKYIIEKVIGANTNKSINKMLVGIGNTKALKTDTALNNRLFDGDVSGILFGNSALFRATFPPNTVTINTVIKEIGLACSYDSIETLITRAVFNVEQEIFITPSNILTISYYFNFIDI